MCHQLGHCWSICSPPAAAAADWKLIKRELECSFVAPLRPWAVLHSCTTVTGSIQGYRFACRQPLPPPSPPTALHCQTPQSKLILDPSHPPTHLLPVLLNSRTAVIGQPSPHSLLCVIIPPASPCTPHCWGPGRQGRPAGCSPFPPSHPFSTFWTLPPFQLCSLGRLGATIVRRGSVRQGVTSHQRTTRGALTTSSEAQKSFRITSRRASTTLTFSVFYTSPASASPTPGILCSWLAWQG